MTLGWNELARAFEEEFHAAPEIAARAPGRVNIIGEHIDYNGGTVLPIAIQLEVRAAAAPSGDGVFHLVSRQQQDHFDGALPPDRSGLTWAAYVFGVVHEFEKLGLRVPPFSALFDGDIPVGSGLSSSAAIEVATAFLIQRMIGSMLTGMELAELAKRAENQFVGVACGLMDMAASALSKENGALKLDCATNGYEHIAIEFPGAVFVVAHSGVRRGLSASAYNQRRSECEEALAAARRLTTTPYANLCEVPPEVIAGMERSLDPVVFRRARHVTTEQRRVIRAVDKLTAGDAAGLGLLLDDSHESLRTDYEVSCRELDELVDWLRAGEGVYGARLTGAGFGGCTVALARADVAFDLLNALENEFYKHKGISAPAFVCRAAAGATVQPPA